MFCKRTKNRFFEQVQFAREHDVSHGMLFSRAVFQVNANVLRANTNALRANANVLQADSIFSSKHKCFVSERKCFLNKRKCFVSEHSFSGHANVSQVDANFSEQT